MRATNKQKTGGPHGERTLRVPVTWLHLLSNWKIPSRSSNKPQDTGLVQRRFKMYDPLPPFCDACFLRKQYARCIIVYSVPKTRVRDTKVPR